VSGRASSIKSGGMAEVGAPISPDGVAVHLHCSYICLCYLHFVPENPEDGEMYLLVPAHPGGPGHSPESHKTVVVVVVVVVIVVVVIFGLHPAYHTSMPECLASLMAVL